MVVCLKDVGIRLSEGEVKNVSEDTCQLVRACFEYTFSRPLESCKNISLTLSIEENDSSSLNE
jgi:hypothetical protein